MDRDLDFWLIRDHVNEHGGVNDLRIEPHVVHVLQASADIQQLACRLSRSSLDVVSVALQPQLAIYHPELVWALVARQKPLAIWWLQQIRLIAFFFWTHVIPGFQGFVHVSVRINKAHCSSPFTGREWPRE